MVLGILQLELFIHGAESLKDKRRVVRSVKDRLHREHQVSVAEVGSLEVHTRAVLGLALVGSDGERVGTVLDAIVNKLRSLTDAELGDVSREIIHGRGGPPGACGPGSNESDPTDSAAGLESELLDRGRRAQDELGITGAPIEP